MDKEEGQTAQERGIILDGTVGENEMKKGEITEKNFHKMLRQFFEWTKIKWLPFQIFLRGYNWKKRGYKGRIEVWDAKGKFVSAHKTLQDAIDSVPNRSVIKKARNDDKKKRRGDKIPD